MLGANGEGKTMKEEKAAGTAYMGIHRRSNVRLIQIKICVSFVPSFFAVDDFDTAKILHAANWHCANNSLEGAMHALGISR